MNTNNFIQMLKWNRNFTKKRLGPTCEKTEDYIGYYEWPAFSTELSLSENFLENMKFRQDIFV